MPERESTEARLSNHIQKEHTLLEARLTVLERRQDSLDDMQKRVVSLECNFKSVSSKVDNLMLKFDAFTKEVKEDFNIFTNKIRDINTKFVFWLVGTVLISLIVGLFCQYQAFEGVHKTVHKLECKLIEMKSLPKKEP